MSRSRMGGSHFTRQPETLLVCRRLDRSELVGRYVLGVTRSHRHRRLCGSMSVWRVLQGAVKMRVWTGGGHQALIVYPAKGVGVIELLAHLKEMPGP